MKIDHIAVWTHDLERLRTFYINYFGALSNEKYVNRVKKFESYFLSFNGGARLELMQMQDVAARDNAQETTGWAHIALKAESRETVDALTEKLSSDGYTVASGPRVTGDGYYESVILDPDGNRVEITA